MILQEQGYEIIVTRKKGCRRLILRAVPMERAFHMTVPWHATVGEIKAFAASNQAWLREHAEVLSQWEPRLEKGEQHRLLGQWVTLGENGVNIRMITQGPEEMNIIVGVEEKDFAQAIRVLYNTFMKENKQ